MLFLLDANVLIDANRDYYPIEAVPEFWEWLVEQGQEGSVKIPIEIYEEITQGKEDDLSKWAREKGVKEALLFDEEVDINLVQKVTDDGYASDLSDIELIKVGRDPFLIAYALSAKNRIIVTTEVSKPKKVRGNKHVPDVCKQFKVRTMNTFEFIKIMKFTTRKS